MDLSSARVLITGASRGIGLEIARTLHAQGATIIGTARSEASIAAAVEELDIIPVVGDLNDPVVADRVIDEALTHGPIDVLINNAGIEIVGQVAEQDPDDLAPSSASTSRCRSRSPTMFCPTCSNGGVGASSTSRPWRRS